VTAPSVARRRLFAPEVIQTSAMDCGPASLKSLLEGFYISVGYGRLREACSTDVDGTSINTLEDVAVELGLDAEQVMLPHDHLLLPESGILPAILVVQLPNSGAHFVVVWRLHGNLVQVMDPAIGRRWLPRAALLRDAYRHELTADAQTWRDYVDSEAFRMPLRRRLTDLGLDRRAARAFVERAAADATWKSFGALDAAVRMLDRLVASGAVRAGGEAEQLLMRLLLPSPDGSDRTASVPEDFWTVRPAAPGPDGEERIRVRGAILVHTSGPRRLDSERSTATASQLAPELLAALKAPPPSRWAPFLRAVRNAGGPVLAIAFFATMVAAATVLLQALLLRSVIDLGYWLGIGEHRLGTVLALAVFLVAALLLDLPLTLMLQRLGRRLEVFLRVAFARKLPRTADHYFHSRALSDLAERAHSLSVLRELPMLVGSWVRTAFLLAFTALGILWLAPWLVGWVIATVVLAALLSVVSLSLLQEREMRARSHGGVLIRFYLDGLLGISSIRAHGAGPALLREQESVLVHWRDAHRRLQLASVSIETMQAIAGVALAVGLVTTHVAREGTSGSILLVTYWALQLPVLAQSLAVTARQIPAIRNILVRVLEPLDAPEETEEEQTSSVRTVPASVAPPVPTLTTQRCTGVQVEMRNVAVRAGGHSVLESVGLKLAAGEQVAVVGASGAGKSTLVGLLLGWSRAGEGQIFLDGKLLAPKELAYWRGHTAWVDPSVQLFNRRFAENLLYGSEEGISDIATAIDQAELREVLERLPDGMQTMMGEGGALVSGGEGQRVRIGRAWLRRDVRLVLLDEPFRGLGREQRGILLERARRHWAGATMICVTHDVSSTLAFDRVLVVDKGRVVEDGAPRALSADASTRYHSMLTAEQFVRENLWASQQWRHFSVDDGKIEERIPSEPGQSDTAIEQTTPVDTPRASDG
jgi:ABC-type bacteriocin/lantibiotic exporter with double-glycine peptidase domain